MRFAATCGATVSRLFRAGIFAAAAAALASPASGQALGVEVYLYGDFPIPPEVIADNYIERVILPALPPELGPLWLEAKDAERSMDGAIDTYFSSRTDAPAPELRQTYLQTLMLLNQLRDAIGIREQLALTPDSYSARAGQPGFLPVEGLDAYLTHTATYLSGGDHPQEAALKAAVTWIHDRDRRVGSVVRECFFENPQTRWHGYCVIAMLSIDEVFRDVTMAELYPFDAQAMSELTRAHFGPVIPPVIQSRISVLDAITLLLLPACERGTSSQSCWPNGDFRRHRERSILTALERRDEYRAALQQRQSDVAQANRPTVENSPLSGFLSIVAAGMTAMILIESGRRSNRGVANAADPRWAGHENDEWCYIENVWYSSGRLQTNTYCQAYDGWIRGITGSDGSLVGAVRAMLNQDPCSGVKGWCRPGSP